MAFHKAAPRVVQAQMRQDHADSAVMPLVKPARSDKGHSRPDAQLRSSALSKSAMSSPQSGDAPCPAVPPAGNELHGPKLQGQYYRVRQSSSNRPRLAASFRSGGYALSRRPHHHASSAPWTEPRPAGSSICARSRAPMPRIPITPPNRCSCPPIINTAFMLKHRIRADETYLFTSPRSVGHQDHHSVRSCPICAPAAAPSSSTSAALSKPCAPPAITATTSWSATCWCCRLLNAVPSLDPFLLREHLRNNEIDVAPCYFAISAGDQERMHRFVFRRTVAAGQLAGGGDDRTAHRPHGDGACCPARWTRSWSRCA